MAKYLDSNGLSHLIAKIKDYIDDVIQSVGAITGVKGDAESTYRTGNVNLTPANIGAAESSHVHAASDVSSGTLDIARIPTGTGASQVALGNHTHDSYMGAASDGTYYGLATPAGATNVYIRGPQTGFIPYQSGGSGYLGTSSWPWNYIYGKNIYQNGTKVSVEGHNHAAGDINSGTLALARGGTGASLSAAPSIITNLASTAGASPFAASPRPGVTGILPRANGGTGINNAGNWSGSAAGTDVVAGAASTWYTAHSLSIPAGRGILIANISLSSGTGGTIYARLTSRTLAQTKTDDPNYQTTEDGIWFCRAESNVLCNGHIVMFYNHSAATTYYLHWKSLNTSSALRFGRIAYMQIAAN